MPIIFNTSFKATRCSFFSKERRAVWIISLLFGENESLNNPPIYLIDFAVLHFTAESEYRCISSIVSGLEAFSFRDGSALF